MPRFPLVAVVGVGHSGSTLLGGLLNAHPRAVCVGEFARVGKALELGSACGCGRATAECPFWKPLLPRLAGERGHDRRDLTPELYDGIRRHAGADVLVDISKTLGWRMAQRPAWRGADVGFLWLVRDTRGVMASPHRQGKPVVAKLPRHRKWIGRLEGFMAKQGERGLTVFYEDLATNPEAELERICAWMGLELDPAMLAPGDVAQHFVHANPMSFLGRGNAVRLDERWREELPADVRTEIEACMRRTPFLRRRYLEPERTRG